MSDTTAVADKCANGIVAARRKGAPVPHFDKSVVTTAEEDVRILVCKGDRIDIVTMRFINLNDRRWWMDIIRWNLRDMYSARKRVLCKYVP